MTIEMTRPATVARAPIDATPLRRLCGGAVHLPGDPGYDAARLPWNAAVDQRPAAVVFPRSAADVAEVVRAAAGLGLRVAPQSTGHNAGPLAAQGLDDVVIVRTSGLDDGHGRPRARRSPGSAAARSGSPPSTPRPTPASPCCTAPRRTSASPATPSAAASAGTPASSGLATNNLTAVELVTATAPSSARTPSTNAPLFWALRGGGGNFGVVTALEFRMFDFDTAYAGMLVWDVRHAATVLRTWAAWAPDAPDEVTTSFRILRVPPMPEMPEPLRGRELVVIDGAVLDTDERGREILGGAAGARARRWTPSPGCRPRTLIRLHMDPEGPTPVTSATTMLADAARGGRSTAFLDQVGAGRVDVAADGRDPAARRRARPAARRRRRAVALRGSVPRRSAGRSRPPRRWRRPGHADATRLVEALAPWANGRQLPQLRRGAGRRTLRVTPTGAWIQLTGIRSAYRPRRALRRQPPGAAPLRGRAGHGLNPVRRGQGARRPPRSRPLGFGDGRRSPRPDGSGSRRTPCSAGATSSCSPGSRRTSGSRGGPCRAAASTTASTRGTRCAGRSTRRPGCTPSRAGSSTSTPRHFTGARPDGLVEDYHGDRR